MSSGFGAKVGKRPCTRLLEHQVAHLLIETILICIGFVVSFTYGGALEVIFMYLIDSFNFLHHIER